MSKETLLFRVLEEHLGKQEALNVIQIIADICDRCWDVWKPCHCWNDE
jgi:hypothetical protein